MNEQRKVLISLPEDLLNRADEAADTESINRSELIRRAMKLYLAEKHKIETRERMKRGYEAMAGINKEWAEAGMASEKKALDAYEAVLAESDRT